MKIPSTKKEIIENLKDLLAVETVTRDDYYKDTFLFTDNKLKTTIQKIKIDEDKHIALLNNAISLLEIDSK